MQVILLERIEKLGQMGDVVNVKDGFARNFLVPHGKAMRATKANRADFDRRRVQLEAANLERKEEAHRGRRADRRPRRRGAAPGRRRRPALRLGQRPRHRRRVRRGRHLVRPPPGAASPAPLKDARHPRVRVALHPEVFVTVEVNIARSAEEAEMQANPELAAAAAEAEAAERAGRRRGGRRRGGGTTSRSSDRSRRSAAARRFRSAKNAWLARGFLV